MKKYIAYYRVSTKMQGNSGLGLDAQKNAVQNYISQHKAEISESYTEVESGKKNNRPEMLKAISRCKEIKATLLIAKLDRLSRNVIFIFQLKEELDKAGVGFIAADFPDLNTMTLGMLATISQYERELISQRTKAGLQAAKRRGQILGKPENLTDAARLKAIQSIKTKAREDNSIRHAFHYIESLKEQGMSYQTIADMLNKEGYKTRNGMMFHPMQVYNIYNRFKNS